MRLAVFEAEEPRAGQVTQDHLRMRALEVGEHRRQQRREHGERGDGQLTRDVVAPAADAAGELGELVVGGLCDAQEILPRLGGRVAARVALEELDAQPRLQRVDMPDHGGVVDAQRLGRAADGAGAGDVIGGADLVPVVHGRPVRW
jgi:hypothetical protein